VRTSWEWRNWNLSPLKDLTPVRRLELVLTYWQDKHFHLDERLKKTGAR
jgi:hypothetical protein